MCPAIKLSIIHEYAPSPTKTSFHRLFGLAENQALVYHTSNTNYGLCFLTHLHDGQMHENKLRVDSKLLIKGALSKHSPVLLKTGVQWSQRSLTATQGKITLTQSFAKNRKGPRSIGKECSVVRSLLKNIYHE